MYIHVLVNNLFFDSKNDYMGHDVGLLPIEAKKKKIQQTCFVFESVCVYLTTRLFTFNLLSHNVFLSEDITNGIS